MTFDENAQYHEIRVPDDAIMCSLHERDEVATKPIYVSNSEINKEKQFIVASESEANQGG